MLPPRLQKLFDDALRRHRAGRAADALPLYRQVLAAAPRHFQSLHLAGAAAFQLGQPADAVALLRTATAVQPKAASSWMVLGLALAALQQRRDAEPALRRAVDLEPTNAEAWTNYGNFLVVGDRRTDAIAALRRAVQLKPDYAHAWSCLGSTLLLAGRGDEAIAAHTRVLTLDPHHASARHARAQALLSCQRVSEALADFDAQLAAHPGHLESQGYRLFALNYLSGISREALFAAHVAYGKRAMEVASTRPELEPALAPSVGSARTGAPRLRVAFLSPDLRRHSVAYFLEPLLARLPAAGFEVILYHDHFCEDDVSARLRAHAGLWRNFVGQPDAAVGAVIRSDAPDLLVDLAGHTGLNRLALLARRLAPVQISYLGYPNTTGLPTMDYRFVDAVTDPADEADGFATEKLVRFGPTAWAYQPPHDAPSVVPPPSVATPGVAPVFGSFNAFSKLSDATLAVWAQLLAAVPSARLLLKSPGLDPTRGRERCIAAGLPSERLEFLPSPSDVASHLALYAQLDVALDPFPYGGTTTTCEALWMGRPVVTLAGDRHAARVGASLLTALGRTGWIATDTASYVATAASLVRDPAALAAISAGLRAELRASPLLDHDAQAARFAAALRTCWQERCAAHAGATEPAPAPAVVLPLAPAA